MTGALVIGALAVGAAVGGMGASPPALVQGEAQVVYRLSPGLEPPAYHNAGFEQRVDGGNLSVRLELRPGFSREPYPLRSAATVATLAAAAAPIRQLARDAVAGATSEDQAVTRVLEAVAARLSYDAAAPVASEAAETALALGRTNCVGYSNLAVAALGAAAIPARVVRGLLLDDDGRATPHRWVEIHYDDAGWVFSDPIASVNYVDVRHVLLRLPGREEADYDPTPFVAAPFRVASADGALLVVDRAPGEGRLARRRNLAAHSTAAVAGYVRGGRPGQDVLLAGRRQSWSTRLDRDLAFSFLGLAPGRYTLSMARPDGGELRRPLEVEAYGLETLHLSLVAR